MSAHMPPSLIRELDENYRGHCDQVFRNLRRLDLAFDFEVRKILTRKVHVALPPLWSRLQHLFDLTTVTLESLKLRVGNISRRTLLSDGHRIEYLPSDDRASGDLFRFLDDGSGVQAPRTPRR